MQCEIEELEFTVIIKGQKVPVIMDCVIEITDWDYEPADSGMPASAWRGGEPAYDENYTATDFAFVGYITLLNTLTDEEKSVHSNSKNLLRQLILAFLKQQVWEYAPWEAINEKLTEQQRG